MSHFDRFESWVETGSASLHVTQAGDGTPALVFLHYCGQGLPQPRSRDRDARRRAQARSVER